jgi:hypothetical protein
LLRYRQGSFLKVKVTWVHLVSLNSIPHNWPYDSRRPSWDWRALEAVAGLVSEVRIATSFAIVQKVVKGWTGTLAVYRE